MHIPGAIVPRKKNGAQASFDAYSLEESTVGYTDGGNSAVMTVLIDWMRQGVYIRAPNALHQRYFRLS